MRAAVSKLANKGLFCFWVLQLVLKALKLELGQNLRQGGVGGFQSFSLRVEVSLQPHKVLQTTRLGSLDLAYDKFEHLKYGLCTDGQSLASSRFFSVLAMDVIFPCTASMYFSRSTAGCEQQGCGKV